MLWKKKGAEPSWWGVGSGQQRERKGQDKSIAAQEGLVRGQPSFHSSAR